MARKKNKENRKVLVVGSGVAGMRAAYDLASVGIEVTLLEPRTYTGGTVMQLDEQFPTDACGICRMQPRVNGFPYAEFCLRKDFVFPGVEVLRDASIEKIEGGKKSKLVTIMRKGLRVDENLCIGCGKCTDVCPIEIADEFNAGIIKRKAIDLASPNAIPSLYSIDENSCTRCGKCVEVCPTDAIHIGEDEKIRLEFDAVLLTPGFEEFVPTEMTEYGYGIFPDVVTSIDLERMYSTAGPNSGELHRPSDSKIPQKIAFIQCVGSRNEEHPYCSSACCMYSMKESRHIKKILLDADVKIFFMDVRAFGKDYYRYELDTQDKGIEFIRCRVPKVYKNDATGELELVYENIKGTRIREDFDMVVLSVGQVVTESVRKLAESADIETDKWGFAKLPDLKSLETSSKDVFVAGSFESPKDIAESITQASAASAEIIARLGIDGKQESQTIYGNPPDDGKIGIVLCKCAGTISDNVDWDKLTEYFETKKDVAEIIQIDTLCTQDGLNRLQNFAADKGFKTIVIGACQSNAYNARYAKTLAEKIDNPPNLRVVDVRNAVWTISDDERLDYVRRTMSMEIAFAGHGRPLDFLYKPPLTKSPAKRAVVIGAGLAGLTAAEFLGSTGIDVTIIEKNENIGGVNFKHSGSLGNTTTGKYIDDLIAKIEKRKNVEILTGTTIKSLDGGVGAYKIVVSDKNGDYFSLDAGSVIVATGASAHETDKFAYGKSPKIMLWNDFENEILPNETLSNIVFIQCADSRNEKRPWCNRICCNKTIELSLKIEDKNPDAKIWVLNRDIMTYGHHELEYAEARKRGVIFIRYLTENEPVVETNGEQITIKAYDPLLDSEILIHPDYVVLQTGIDPNGDDAIAERIIATDGFWNGLDSKFSPQETRDAGIFVIGSGRMPMSADEAIQDALAGAGRAVRYLLSNNLPARNQIAYVRERSCIGCRYCVDACAYDARIFDTETRKVAVISEQCMGCGACAVACPSEATVMIAADKNKVHAAILEAVMA
ncbi:CoB--CoM heterodisulfide reductase iron-sulfur subunit A family protein [bacterium]|nr:CoB--CoM heterodisulfide reductase iron-sulfur subunit A family protein [bacterium]